MNWNQIIQNNKWMLLCQFREQRLENYIQILAFKVGFDGI